MCKLNNLHIEMMYYANYHGNYPPQVIFVKSHMDVEYLELKLVCTGTLRAHRYQVNMFLARNLRG